MKHYYGIIFATCITQEVIVEKGIRNIEIIINYLLFSRPL